MSKTAIITRKIVFNKTIYCREAIDQTIKAFKKIALFEIKENKNQIIVLIKGATDIIEIVDEFINYVLAETIMMRQYLTD